MPTDITALPLGPDATWTTPVQHGQSWADSAWAWITSSTGTTTLTALLAALLGATAAYAITRQPGKKNDFSRHLMYAPILLVNAAAIYGQVAFFYEKVAPPTWPIPGKLALSILIAAAVESIAVYVGWHAHDALLNKASATAARLRRASYVIAGIVGLINYTHFAGNTPLDPTAASVAFGLLSLLSPWLWGLHTRRAQHVQLTNEGAVDSTGATFSGERIRLFPFRAYMARRWSVDHYVTDPQQAWEGYNAHLEQKRSEKPSTRIQAAWLVLTGHAEVKPGLMSGRPNPTRADVMTGHPTGVTPDTTPAIEADTATGGAQDSAPVAVPDMPLVTAPDMNPTPAPDTRRLAVPDTTPVGIEDTGSDLMTDTRPDTTAARMPVPRRPQRRTPHQTPKWTKEQLKAFKLRDIRPDMTYPMIAREVGVSEKTVSRWFKARDAAETPTVPDIKPDIIPTFDLPKTPAFSSVNGSHPTLTEENR